MIDDDFEPSEVDLKEITPEENLEETENVHPDIGSSSPLNGLHLPMPASSRTSDNIATTRKYFSHQHRRKNPTDRNFSGRQTAQEQISGVRNSVWNTLRIVYRKKRKQTRRKKERAATERVESSTEKWKKS
jgi:hypothetical protein